MVFPKRSIDNYALIQKAITRGLTSVTLCSFVKVNPNYSSDEKQCAYSYAVPGQHNELSFCPSPTLQVIINGASRFVFICVCLFVCLFVGRPSKTRVWYLGIFFFWKSCCPPVIGLKGYSFCFSIVLLKIRFCLFYPLKSLTIVSRGNWLWKPATFKGDNKAATVYVGRDTTVHNLFFYVGTSRWII